ncbi:MAG TPA: alpha/beta hydrolase [Candidatus Saccharimonadales bacterium]|nr:alpha/beta hydrolase [Candidatus Saccharimonadales bacterium]
MANESRELNEARKLTTSGAKRQPNLTTPIGLKAARDARRPSGTLTDRKVVEGSAEANGRSVPIRMVKPKSGKSQGVFLNIPGGGFYLDESARNDEQNARFADALGVTVISLAYRLAPENPYPAAPDDCVTVAHWLTTEAEPLFKTSRLIIGGASAGATLAMATLLRLKDSNLATRFAGTVLQFGAYDLSGQTPGSRLYADEYFIQMYAGGQEDKTQPGISPLYGNLHDLPPTLMIVGTSDILMEDTFAMAARLSAAGNEVDLRVYPEAKHGFTAGPTKMAAAAKQDIIEWIKRR